MARLHPALWTLIRLRSLGRIRRALTDLRTPSGALVFLFGFAIVGLSIESVRGGHPLSHSLTPDQLGELYRSGMLMFLFVGQIKALGDRAIYFSRSEADFLFAGPFHRRDLLVYRVISGLGGIFLMSVVFTILFASLDVWWPAVFIGALLSFFMLHVLAMCIATLREVVEERVFSIARRAAVVAVICLVVVSVAYGFQAQARHGPLSLLHATYSAWTMKALLLPFVPFSSVVTARALDGSFLFWLGFCGVANFGLFRLLIWLDSENFSALEYRNLSSPGLLQRPRARRSKQISTGQGLSLLLLPHLKGVGTVAAVQLNAAIRGYRLAAELALVVILIAVAFSISRAGADSAPQDIASSLLQVTMWTSILVSNPLRFDFRSGSENIEYLKTLPLPAWAVCLGQLTTPVLMTLLYQLPFLVIALVVASSWMLIVAVIVAPILDLIWYALENFTFLLYPSSVSGRGLGDIQFFGRQLLMLCTKLAVLGVGVILAVGVGYLFLTRFPGNGTGFFCLVALVLAMEAALVIGLLSAKFKRFDPSRVRPFDS
jgi:hypothetical protein